MATLRLNFKLNDDQITLIQNPEYTYNRRFVFNRILKSTDGAVTIDLSGVGTIVAIFITTDHPVTLTFSDASTKVVSSNFLITSTIDLESITNLDALNDASVAIYAYGYVA